MLIILGVVLIQILYLYFTDWHTQLNYNSAVQRVLVSNELSFILI